MVPEKKRPSFGPEATDLEKLVALSRYYGADGSFVLAGGGNTSVKSGDTIYVKASGHALAAISEEGFVALDRGALSALLEGALSEDPERREAEFKEAVLAARTEGQKAARPSVECVLHNVLPEKFVVHTHPTFANMVACSMHGDQLAAELFGQGCLVLPYVDPGYVLARALAGGLEDYRNRTGRQSPETILMLNHGLLVGGADPAEVITRTEAVIAAVRRRLPDVPLAEPFGAVSRIDPTRARALVEIVGPALRGLLGGGGNLKVVTFDDGEAARALVGGESGAEAARGGPLTPDQIVYCHSFPLWFETVGDESGEELVERLRQAIAEHKEQTGFDPKVVLIKGLGLVAAGHDFAAAETVRLVYTDAIRIMAGAARLGGIRYMGEREREFIERWEVEQYRREIAAGAAARGRAAGKVAVVTGAAQGFGFEIAADLVREGGHVALTDVNEEGVSTVASGLAAEAGEERVVALAMDVTDAASIADAIHAIVRKYGGFDVLVSNAGVLKAGSVLTMPEEDFDFVTSVNYRGYFLCVKHAAPILAVQHMAKPDYSSDIIQVNSKSGLRGSNRNAAYAGGKFGGIGLTQSFALELIEHGIKVNAVCPGNFFDGPLWSDPENGLFVQYLGSGKVPGAKSIADVRRAYEARIPMGRGCTSADVMKAIYYLVEQKYETGQAIAVTGGQVMLG